MITSGYIKEGTTINIDLNAIMRRIWDDDHETDPRKAAREIVNLIPEDQDEEVLLHLLALAYSTFLSTISREPPMEEEEEQEKTGTVRRKVRHNAAINPGTHADDIIRDLDQRPFWIPSKGTHTRVLFKDMTVEHWGEYARFRRSRAAGYLASAQWADLNVAKLREHGVTTSGELPDDVKRELFAGEPDVEE